MMATALPLSSSTAELTGAPPTLLEGAIRACDVVLKIGQGVGAMGREHALERCAQSAHAGTGRVGMEAGFEYFLRKPATVEQFEKILRKVAHTTA